MSAFHSYGIFWRRLFFTLLTLCVIAALIIQDHTHYLPLGVFTTDTNTIARIGLYCLGAAVLFLVIQLIELFSGRLGWLGAVIRGLYVVLIILDVLLIFGERVFVAANPAGTLGPYYELADPGTPPVILEMNADGAPLAPCLDAASNTGGARILFLGDASTAGTGSSPECNYPDVVERVLREQWLSDVHVVNAGVAGYGPVEALSLLRWYRNQNCRVHGVVYTLSLQNDLADNLPGTTRRVVAGTISRFPRNLFLRVFHPLNTRVFRWTAVLVKVGSAPEQESDNVPGGPCDLTPDSLTEVTSLLRSTIERDYDTLRRVAGTLSDFNEAARAIEEMRAVASGLDVPFFLVIFPDRLLADEPLRNLMGIQVPDASAQAHGFASGLGADRVLDVYGQLAGKAGMYRALDTHLSDLGNVVAGEYVGTTLAEYFSGMPLRPQEAGQ